VAEAGPLTGGADDLVQTWDRERLSSTRPFERDEDRIGRRFLRSLVVHVARHGGEEGRRQWHQTFVSALAFGDEHSPLAETQIGELQPEHFAAAEPSEDHGLGHGPVPLGAQRTHERLDLIGVENPG